MLLTLALACALPLGACTTNEATGRSQFNFLSREDEIALGKEAGPELTQSYGGEVPDAALRAYVTGVGMQLVRHTEGDFPSLPWKFTLLNSDVINAFALPGGQVFVSRALAEKFTSEADLAGVLGHEVGHVTAEHADRGITRQIGLTALAVGASILAGNDQNMQLASQAVIGGAGVYALTFSRDQEIEADKLGMRYMVAAGYNPVGMLRVMQVLAKASEGNSQWEIFSTHPDPKSRIAIIQRRLDDRYAKLKGDPAYGLYEARFQTEFLDRIKNLPPAPSSPQSRLDLSQPHLWCAHCAEARRYTLAHSR